MTRVMDGVRRVRATPPPAAPARRQEVARPAQAARPVAAARPVVAARTGLGLDGVRRTQGPTGPVIAAAPVAPEVPRKLARQLPQIPWRRAGMAAGLAVVALTVSVATVRVLATPRSTTARAEAETAAPSGTPSAMPAKVSGAPAAKTGLQTMLNNFAAANPGKFSIVVKGLTSGDTASVDSDEVMESASLYKLFVADQIYHLIDSGGLSYNSEAGSGNTVQGCLTLMITISDNACGVALGTILNWGAQDPALAAQGYRETDLGTPQQTSARDVAALFEHLYDGTLNSAASNAALLSLLKAQKVNDRLPQGLPAGTVIAHKTGNLDDVVHDGGIVYGPKTAYLVVVMSNKWSAPGNVPPMFVSLSQQLWSYFED